MWYPGGGKNGRNLCGAREKRVEPVWGKGKTRGTCVGQGKNAWDYSTKSTQSAWGPRIAWT